MSADLNAMESIEAGLFLLGLLILLGDFWLVFVFPFLVPTFPVLFTVGEIGLGIEVIDIILFVSNPLWESLGVD